MTNYCQNDFILDNPSRKLIDQPSDRVTMYR